MSDKPYYHEDNQKVLLTLWAFRHTMRGVGWACAGFVVVIAIYVVLRGVAGFLPPESKEAPSPYGALEQSVPADLRVV